jgi:hypothetical protein
MGKSSRRVYKVVVFFDIRRGRFLGKYCCGTMRGLHPLSAPMANSDQTNSMEAKPEASNSPFKNK